MPVRHKAPVFGRIEKISWPAPEKKALSNGLSMQVLSGGIHPIIRLDILFPSGTRYTEIPLVAQATIAMLQEGTRKYTASEIAGKLDYFGASLKTSLSPDMAGLTVYTLSKHLEPVLNIVLSMLNEPVFPEDELSVFLKKRKQQFLVELNKVSTLARMHFAGALFGNSHPYGRSTNENDFDRIRRDMLVEFRKNTFTGNQAMILASGLIRPEDIRLLQSYLSQLDMPEGARGKDSFPPPFTMPRKRLTVLKEGSIQSALRIGRLLFNRLHPDFPGMLVVNSLLGSYFGSRLMKNIREDKGYTYGIGSFLLSLHNGGFFAIVTEVGTEYTQSAIDEVYREIDRMRNENIPDSELELVRNFMMGEMVREFDGPFASASAYQSVLEYGLGFGHYDELIRTILNITPGDIRRLAEKYLDPEAMTEVVAGDVSHQELHSS